MQKGQGLKNIDPLVVIGWLKLLKAIALLALGIGLFRLMHGNFDRNLERLLRELRFDPNSHFLRRGIEKLTGINRHTLKLVGVGTFFYAGLYLAEGIGLLLRQHWAEWLTVVGTVLLIPLEIHEIVVHVTAVRILVLVVNVVIFAYLVYRLREQHVSRKRDGDDCTRRGSNPQPSVPKTDALSN